MEQDLKLRNIYDALNKPETRREDIITFLMALQKQNFVLGNSLTNLVEKWQEREILMDLNRPQESVEMFETSLVRMPNRPRSLLGLARSYIAMGNDQEAGEAYQSLTEVWRDRESFAGFQEARRFLEEDGQGGLR